MILVRMSSGFCALSIPTRCTRNNNRFNAKKTDLHARHARNVRVGALNPTLFDSLVRA